VSVFDGKSREQIRDEANPGSTVHIDGRKESLSHGIQQAILLGVSPARAETLTPTGRMKVEHARLFKAFREAEGRDPDAHGDPEFWEAHASITRGRGQGGSVAKDVTAAALDLDADDDSEPVRKTGPREPAARAAGREIGQRLRKRLEEGPGPDEPAWITSIIERSR
jgi:hypothetical protein